MRQYVIIFITMFIGSIRAGADYYAATNGNHVYPYDAWDKAATNIQAAITAAVDNATVWVSNGVYVSAAVNSTVVTISDKSLNLRATSGNRTITIIDGGGTNRGVYINMSTPKIVLFDGFTITNCSALDCGGGIRLNHTAITQGTGIVQNCVIAGNVTRGSDAWYGGGGIYSRGANPSSFLTMVSNCTITGNSVQREGGGGIICYYAKVIIQDCQFLGNKAQTYVYATGGGILMSGNSEDSVVRNCLIQSNSAPYFGAGIYTLNGPRLENCAIRYNSGPYGVGIYVSGNSRTNIVRNCQISENRATSYACGMHIDSGTVLLENCTIVTNVTLPPGAGYGTGGLFQSGGSTTLVQNTVIYFNYGPSGRSNVTIFAGSCTFQNSCIAPLPSGTGNTSNNPLFVAATGGDFKLTPQSPCINFGLNQPWMNGAKDLNNHSRIDVFSGKVDMGSYEYHPRGTIYKIH